MRRILALLFMMALAPVFAQVRPQSIIVNPVPPADLRVQVWVDKDPGKTGNPVYNFGENIEISVRVTQDAYVYLFGVRSTGEIDGILPNSFDQDNFLRAGETRTYPSNAQYTFTIDPPAGQDRVLAVASRTPLDVNDIVDIQTGQAKIRGADNLARSLSIVVRPIPSNDWVTDEAYYIAGNLPPPPPPATGTLSVSANVSGAAVLLNGRNVGNAPINLTLNPGTYTLEVRRSGYNPYRVTVNVQAGQTARINAQLQPVAPPPPPTGTLVVNSNVRGAEVLINGRRVGYTPLTITLNAGNYSLLVRRGGYSSFSTSFYLAPGTTSRINANLRDIIPQPQPVPVPPPAVTPSGRITYVCNGGRLVVDWANPNLVRVFYDDAFQSLPLSGGGNNLVYSNGNYTWQYANGLGSFAAGGGTVRTNCRPQ
ncbi:MAG: PEGA domain-containing protein [Meiothermus sp.]